MHNATQRWRRRGARGEGGRPENQEVPTQQDSVDSKKYLASLVLTTYKRS